MQVVKTANYSDYFGLERYLHLNSLMIINSSRRGIILIFFSIFQVIISVEGNKVFLVNFNFYLLYFAISE